MSLQNIPYNSKIYLVSTLDYRYEGTLHCIDTGDNTITLTNVRSLGTLQSPLQIPPVYEYFIFRASDIKHIEVSEPVVYLTNQYTGYPSYVLLPFFLWNQGNTATPPPAQTPATVDPKAVYTMDLNLKDSVFDSTSVSSSNLDVSQLEPQVTVTDLKSPVTPDTKVANLSNANTILRPDINELTKSLPNKRFRNHQEKIWKVTGKPVENTSTTSQVINENGELDISEKDKMNTSTKQLDGWKLDNSRGGLRFPVGRRANLKYRPKEAPSDDNSGVIINIVASNPEKSISCEDKMEIITLVPSSDDPDLSKNKKHQRK